MDLITAIKEHQSDYKGQFHLIINDQDKSQIIDFNGYFTKSGQSIYAHYDDLGLVAGSQSKNENEAMMKSIMRLIQMITIKISRTTSKSDFKVSADKLLKFQEFIKRSGLVELDESKTDIPVYSELFENTENGHRYSLKKLRSTVSNLKDIQESKHELLNENNSNQIINILTEKDTIAKKEYELAVVR